MTRLLERMRAGDEEATPELFERLYSELRRLAASLFRSQRQNHTLQPTALVHEAYFKLAKSPANELQDRAHFFNVAARAMRQILMNHARDRAAQKRGGPDAHRMTLSGLDLSDGRKDLDILAVNDALERLAQKNERHARIAEMRFFGDLKNEEIAAALGVTKRTVQLDWRMAKAWLAEQLGAG